MSRDKYSNDHTIEVNEGSGTLTVDGNFGFTGDFDIDEISLSSSVVQVRRYGGVAFRADEGSYNDISYNGQGRITFTGASANVYCAVNDLPHGATISEIRIKGAAEGGSDLITLILRKSDGGSHNSLATISLANEGTSPVESTSALTEVVDYTEDQFYYLFVTGQQGTTAAYIDFVDVKYTIQKFPQNTESSPS